MIPISVPFTILVGVMRVGSSRILSSLTFKCNIIIEKMRTKFLIGITWNNDKLVRKRGEETQNSEVISTLKSERAILDCTGKNCPHFYRGSWHFFIGWFDKDRKTQPYPYWTIQSEVVIFHSYCSKTCFCDESRPKNL